MSFRVRSLGYVTCDACQKEGPEGYTSVEARAKAYMIGWRFPPRILANGARSTNRCQDICPNCITSLNEDEAGLSSE